jgi:hypothetical protein
MPWRGEAYPGEYRAALLFLRLRGHRRRNTGGTGASPPANVGRGKPLGAA